MSDQCYKLVKSLSSKEVQAVMNDLKTRPRPSIKLIALLKQLLKENKDVNEITLPEFSTKNLNQSKKKLFDEIVKILRNRNSSDIDLKITNSLIDIQFLFSKAQYTRCLRIIDKTLEVCNKFGLSYYETVLYKYKIQCIGLRAINNDHILSPMDDIESVYTNFEDANTRLTDYFKSLYIQSSCLTLMFTHCKVNGYVNNKKLASNFLKKNEALFPRSQDLGTLEKTLSVQFVMYSLEHNFKEAKKVCEKRMELMLPIKSRGMLIVYISALRALFKIELENENLDTAKALKEKLNSIYEDYKDLYDLRFELYPKSFSLFIDLQLHLGDFSSIDYYLDNFEAILQEKNKNTLTHDHISDFHISCARFYFIQKNYPEVLDALNKIKQVPNLNMLSGIQEMYLLELMTYYELGWKDLLLSRVRTYVHFLKGINQYLDFEKNLHSYFKTLATRLEKNKESKGSELLVELQVLSKTYNVTRLFGLLELWLKTKVQGTDMSLGEVPNL